MYELGPWPRHEFLDAWERNRWDNKLSRAWEYFWHNGKGRPVWVWLSKRLGKGIPHYGGTKWLWHWQPRSCSFCGGVHPEDAIRLLEEGWEVEGTTKSYKWYLHPPGFSAWRRHMFGNIMSHRGEPLGKPAPKPDKPTWSPVPPVKMYSQHWSDEQIDRANAAMAKHRVPDGS